MFSRLYYLEFLLELERSINRSYLFSFWLFVYLVVRDILVNFIILRIFIIQKD